MDVAAWTSLFHNSKIGARRTIHRRSVLCLIGAVGWASINGVLLFTIRPECIPSVEGSLVDNLELNHEQFDALCGNAQEVATCVGTVALSKDVTKFPEDDPLLVHAIQLQAAVMVYIAELARLGRPAFKRYAAANEGATLQFRVFNPSDQPCADASPAPLQNKTPG